MRFILRIILFASYAAFAWSWLCDLANPCRKGWCCVTLVPSIPGLPRTAGTCQLHSILGLPCNLIDADVPGLGGMYIGTCPCKEGLECQPTPLWYGSQGNYWNPGGREITVEDLKTRSWNQDYSMDWQMYNGWNNQRIAKNFVCKVPQPPVRRPPTSPTSPVPPTIPPLPTSPLFPPTAASPPVPTLSVQPEFSPSPIPPPSPPPPTWPPTYPPSIPISPISFPPTLSPSLITSELPTVAETETESEIPSDFGGRETENISIHVFENDDMYNVTTYIDDGVNTWNVTSEESDTGIWNLTQNENGSDMWNVTSEEDGMDIWNQTLSEDGTDTSWNEISSDSGMDIRNITSNDNDADTWTITVVYDDSNTWNMTVNDDDVSTQNEASYEDDEI